MIQLIRAVFNEVLPLCLLNRTKLTGNLRLSLIAVLYWPGFRKYSTHWQIRECVWDWKTGTVTLEIQRTSL